MMSRLLTLTIYTLAGLSVITPALAQSTSDHVPAGLTEVQKRINEREAKEAAERQAAMSAATNSPVAAGTAPNDPSTQGQRNAEAQSGQGPVVEPSAQVGTTPPAP